MVAQYPTLLDVNMTKGVDQLLVYDNMIFPVFSFVLLLIVWFIFSFGTYIVSSRKFGSNIDVWACLATGGVMTSIIAIFMQLTTGLINSWTLTTIICLTIIFLTIFVMSGRRGMD